jgi:hypothetical protein
VPLRSFLARLRNSGSVAARLARSLNTVSRKVPLGYDRHSGVSLAHPAGVLVGGATFHRRPKEVPRVVSLEALKLTEIPEVIGKKL